MPKLGQQHHHAKLSDAQVRDMRQLYQTWKQAKANKGYEALADLFGCGVSTARDIATYRTRISA